MNHEKSIFNTPGYNAFLWYSSGVLTLGRCHLGYNPKVADLITHDPYCPCGLQGAIERNFNFSLAITGAATLSLAYWKWKSLDYVVFGTLSYIFIAIIHWAFDKDNEHKINSDIHDCFSGITTSKGVYNHPVVHLGAMKLKEEAMVDESQNRELANCGLTYDKSYLLEWLHKSSEGQTVAGGSCPTDKLPKEQIKLINNYATWALLKYAISLGEYGGKGNLRVRLLGDGNTVGYYPYDHLAAEQQPNQEVANELELIVAPDGHTYNKEAYVKAMGLTEQKARLLPINKWLADAIQFACSESERD